MERNELVAKALASLTPAESSRSIVYLDERPLAEGTRVRLGDVDAQVPWPALVCFVDLEPAVNWGHPCRYLLLNQETGEMMSINAQFPPFLKSVPSTLRLIWRGPSAPEWAVVAPK